MQNNKVSIVIPSYNAARYVKEAVDSALAQTYKNVEVIVVDDGSTDGTKKILAPYSESKKIRYIYEENKGLAGARNTGIKNSSGEYVAFLDADDLFCREKLRNKRECWMPGGVTEFVIQTLRISTSKEGFIATATNIRPATFSSRFCISNF